MKLYALSVAIAFLILWGINGFTMHLGTLLMLLAMAGAWPAVLIVMIGATR